MNRARGFDSPQGAVHPIYRTGFPGWLQASTLKRNLRKLWSGTKPAMMRQQADVLSQDYSVQLV